MKKWEKEKWWKKVSVQLVSNFFFFWFFCLDIFEFMLATQFFFFPPHFFVILFFLDFFDLLARFFSFFFWKFFCFLKNIFSKFTISKILKTQKFVAANTDLFDFFLEKIIFWKKLCFFFFFEKTMCSFSPFKNLVLEINPGKRLLGRKVAATLPSPLLPPLPKKELKKKKNWTSQWGRGANPNPDLPSSAEEVFSTIFRRWTAEETHLGAAVRTISHAWDLQGWKMSFNTEVCFWF